MGFTEIYRYPGRDSSPLIIPFDIQTSDVILDFGEPLMPSWLVSGSVFCLSTLPDGRIVSSPGVTLPFGSTRLNLVPPSYPYRVKFVPRRGLQYYNLVLSVGSSLSVNSVDTLYLDDSEKALLGDFGLNTDISALSPQNATLLLFFLKSLKESTMQNKTDILAFVGNLDAVIRQSQENKDAVESQGVQLTSVISKAVVVKDFIVQKAAFLLGADGTWSCDIVHDMRSMNPIAAVYDNGTDGLGRDLQLVQVTSKDENRSAIRMTAVQYDDADFPFHCKFSDRTQASLVLTTAPLSSSGRSVSLVNGSLMVSVINGTAIEFDAFRDTPGGPISNIVEVVVAPNGQFHAKRSDDAYFSGNTNEWIGFASNSGNHDGLKAAAGAIVL